MKKEDIEQKLDAIELPEIDVTEHRTDLRASLLTRGLPERHGFFGGILFHIKELLFSRQPVWKTATPGLAIVILAVTLTTILPSSDSDSVYAKALDLINYSRELQETFDQSANQSLQTFTIRYEGNEGTASVADEGTITITFPEMNDRLNYPETIIIDGYNKDGESSGIPPRYTIRFRTSKDGAGNVIITIIDERTE